jgi:hypothetical protein
VKRGEEAGAVQGSSGAGTSSRGSPCPGNASSSGSRAGVVVVTAEMEVMAEAASAWQQ